MPEFTQSWAFWFLIIAISFIAGFVVATILASGRRASSEEERREEEMIVHDAYDREKRRRGGPEIEIATKNNPRTD